MRRRMRGAARGLSAAIASQMSSRSSSAAGETRTAVTRGRTFEPTPCGRQDALAVERTSRPAGLSLVPQLLEAPDLLSLKAALKLPIAQRLAHRLACGGEFPGINRGFERCDLFAGQRNADFEDIRHRVSLCWAQSLPLGSKKSKAGHF